MRWMTLDPAALSLLEGTPVNCILVEPALWSPALRETARKRNVAVLGVIRPGATALELARKVPDMHFDGIVLEGDFNPAESSQLRALLPKSAFPVIVLPSRSRMNLAERPVVGTSQGVWPGIQAEEEGKVTAAPSGAPWIHTNGGFLRFVRAVAPEATVWLGNEPPLDTIHTAERYLQAVSDAAIIGARWILALDADIWKRLLAGESTAVRMWKQIALHLAWFEEHRAWRSMRPLSQLALVQDVSSGALYSGGVLDMISVKHTPVRPVPSSTLSAESMSGLKMAINVDPSGLTESQMAALTSFRRAGGTTLSGPSTWKFPPVGEDNITLTEEDVRTLDEIWKEMNQMTGRRNLGARLFNVSSMLSNLVESRDGKQAVLQLVNYSGFPVENITVHLLTKYKKATLVAPGEKAKVLPLYDNEEGSGVDIDTVGVTATLLLE